MYHTRGGPSHPPISKKLIIARILVVSTLAILPLFVFIIPAKSMSAPNPDPTITNIHVNRNLVSTGDWLIYAAYDIPYASTTNFTAASNAFIFRLMDAAGTTELGAIAPYAYSEFDNGYNEGNLFLYSTGSGLVWGSAYIIRISENPAQFASPTYWDFPIPTTAYTSLTAQLDNQAEVVTNVIAMAETLQSIYGLAMTQPTSGGTALSTYGETYYRGACYGIQAMGPTLFLVKLVQLDTTSTNWTRTQADSWESPFPGTWVEAGENATATQFGITRLSVGTLFIVFPLAIGLMVFSSMKFQRIEPGLVAISILLILSLLMGWIPAAVFASLFQLMAIYTGYVWFYARAS